MTSLALKRQSRLSSEVLIPKCLKEQRTLQRDANQGIITRITKGIYVNVVTPDDLLLGAISPVDLVVQRHWQKILGRIIPGAAVSHLSAFLGGITPNRELTLSHPTRYNTSITLPGLTAVVMRGPGVLPGDVELGDTGLYWSSRPRTLLENLAPTHARRPRTAGKVGVEEKLVEILNVCGRAELNNLLDDARRLAMLLGAQKEFNRLNELVGELLIPLSID